MIQVKHVVNSKGRDFEDKLNSALQELDGPVTITDIKYAVIPGEAEQEIPSYYSALIVYEEQD